MANERTERCSCVRDNGKRCRNEAWREIRVHQEEMHPQVGTRWFWVKLCQKHFWVSSGITVTDKNGRFPWRNL